MRLFVAVNFQAPVRRALADLAARLAQMGLPVRWTAAETFHLTLRWLGDRDEEDRVAVTAILHEIAAEFEPFEAGFGPVGAFPSPRRPRVIWIAVEAGPRLRLLRDELERRLARDGFGRDERSFRPHVTLGRAMRDARPGAFREFVTVSDGLGIDASFPVSSIDLMLSRLEPAGARHERLAAVELGAAGLPDGDASA
ncbi:MAG: RNA 2',3'-cyclic phosphodiesterase [Gemmatimonadota bacterium]